MEASWKILYISDNATLARSIEQIMQIIQNFKEF